MTNIKVFGVSENDKNAIAEIEYRFPRIILKLVKKQKRELRQRWIRTDVWDIDIGHGLDSYKDGKIVRDTTFAVNLI